MKRLLKLSKLLMSHILIFALIQNTFIDTALAANNSGFGAQDITAIANTALGVYSTYLGQKQQFMQQQIAAANNQKLMAQLGPMCRNTDGTFCYSTPAKYFPECPLPASMASMPQNICENPTPEPNQISTMITYEAISKGWINYYDQMSNEASNAANPIGLRCLKDKQKALDSQLIEMQNNIQRLQDRLNQDKQIFRDNNKQLLNTMNTTNDELFGMGGATKNNLNLKTQDFAKYFSPGCQSVIGKDILQGGTSSGLNGILQGLSSSNKAASDFNANKSIIESDVNRETDKIANAIAANGIDDWLNNSSTQTDIKSSNYPSIATAVTKVATELNTARTRINKELADLGYTPPVMDKNFTTDINDFTSQSTAFFQKKYINDCVTGADKGVAIPIADILKNIEQKRTNSAGTATADYRSALQNIIDSDNMMDQKMVMIKALESQYPGITITYKNANQARVTESPYNLFMRTVSNCEQQFTKDQTFSSKGSNGVSYQTKVNRGKADLQELKTLNDSFVSKITQAISNKILNCEGVQSKSGDTCNAETLQTTSENFCVSHASQCAGDILTCYNEANTHVQTRKTKMENLAKVYNANVAAMISRSNALYEQQKASVTNITKSLQAKFPGTNFNIPADMFVPMPGMKSDTYGVDMVADGNLSFLDDASSMPAKLENLKKIFADQQAKLDPEISAYIDLQKNAITTNQTKWKELADKCTQQIDASSKALNDLNKANQDKQATEDKNVATFCKKYSGLADNPVGGCGKAQDLASLSDSISSRISGQASTLTEQYAAACDGYNNESQSAAATAPDDCNNLTGENLKVCQQKQKDFTNKTDPSKTGAKKAKKIKPSAICKMSDGKYTSDEKLISLAANYFPDTDAETIKSAKSFKDLSKKLEDKEIDDGGFFSDLETFATDSNDKTNASKKSICERMQSKINAQTDSTTDEKQNTLNAKNNELNTKKLDDIFASLDEINSTKDEVNAADKATKDGPKIPSTKDDQIAKLQKIGEQMAGPCDMQSTSTMPKSTGFNLQSFDNSVLGVSK